MSNLADSELNDLVERAFRAARLNLADVDIRRFPNETIIVIEVSPQDFVTALSIASELDDQIEDGFVTVRKAAEEASSAKLGRVESLLDPRVADLVEILSARSRTSEQQPSLRYIPDAAQTLHVAMSRRNHLIFGRRGVGKTALMLEAKTTLERRGALTFWINIQAMRSLSAHEAFLMIAARLCDIPIVEHSRRGQQPLSVTTAEASKSRALDLLKKGRRGIQGTHLLIPELQELFGLFSQESQADLYLFLDDVHYLAIDQQPLLLDMIHAITRDNPLWIKAAGIKHQFRWFTDNPPTGLQTGHDAAIINLDITLEQPAKAKEFLTSILRSYTDEAKIGNVYQVISRSAMDRLVLASGGVPRDFLILGATAIQVARQRTARSTGVQDVNEAAGRIAQTKFQELEDDAASAIGQAAARIAALNTLRQFLLEEKQVTYFRVDFQDKEAHPTEYELLQSLMDLRLIHLINPGLSDERRAGQRSEVYMLDLSQFSGSRFRRNLKVLDFKQDHMVLKSTGGSATPRPGNTPRKLQSILRRGPLFELSDLSGHAA